MKENNKNLTVMYILSLIFVAANFIFFPKLWVVQIFAMIYLTVIYKFFADTNKKYLYYTTLLFAFINAGLSLPLGSRYAVYYFYITLFIYMVMFAVEFLKGKVAFDVKAFLKNKYNKFFVIFIVYLVLSIAWAGSKHMAVVWAINYFVAFALLIMINLENTDIRQFKGTFKFLEYLYLGILFLGTLETFGIRYGLRNHYEDINKLWQAERIPVVFFYNPNNYAVFLVLVMTIIFVKLMFEKNKNKRICYYLVYAVSQINLIFTTCRTAWITIFLIFIFCFAISFIKKDKNLRKNVIKFALLTFVIFAALSVLPSMEPYYGKLHSTPIIERLFNFNVDPKWRKKVVLGEAGSVNERYTLMYDVSYGVFIKGHYLGFGVGNISNFVKEMKNTHDVLIPHSLWFEILGDFGIIIFLYFVYICLSMLFDLTSLYVKYKDEDEKYPLMFSACCFGFAFLAFAPSSVITFIPFWVLMAISAVLVNNKYVLEHQNENIIG